MEIQKFSYLYIAMVAGSKQSYIGAYDTIHFIISYTFNRNRPQNVDFVQYWINGMFCESIDQASATSGVAPLMAHLGT